MGLVMSKVHIHCFCQKKRLGWSLLHEGDSVSNGLLTMRMRYVVENMTY
jgi:hypothetical protein